MVGTVDTILVGWLVSGDATMGLTIGGFDDQMALWLLSRTGVVPLRPLGRDQIRHERDRKRLMSDSTYNLDHLTELEAESIYVLREVAAQFDRPAILFSGGKDSIVVTHLASKAFAPGRIPMPLGPHRHRSQLPETIEFRDNLVERLGARLIVGSVQATIDSGKVQEETGANASRNRLQTTTLIDTIEEHQFDACIGGARRDEEKARAKERFFPTATTSASGTPRTSAPNCGTSSTACTRQASTSASSL